MAAAGGAERKLVVEVVEARGLVPKDGAGSASAFAVVDFDGQRKRTQTVPRSLHPTWSESLVFSVSGAGAGDPLEVEILHDKKLAPCRRSNFLGRVRLDPSLFVSKGEEALVFFPLQRKSFFSPSWVRGEIALRVYFCDEPAPAPVPPVVAQSEAPAPDLAPPPEATPDQPPPPPPQDESAAVREPAPVEKPEASATAAPPARQNSRPVIERSAFDLVDKMQYLFVRVVRARGLPGGTASPEVKIAVAGRSATTGPATLRESSFHWDMTFAFPLISGDRTEALEISVWDVPPEPSPAGSRLFLGGVCLDAAEVPARDPPDCPLAAQWHRLEATEQKLAGAGEGDLMVATWLGTQEDDSFHSAAMADGPSRSKIYISPKLWYLRFTVLRCEDIQPPSTPAAAQNSATAMYVTAELGFQKLRTRGGGLAAPPRNQDEDMMFVVAEPLGEQVLQVAVEARKGKEPPVLLGAASLALTAVERRVDHRKVPPTWIDLLPRGRLQVQICFDGGYHVADEPPHAASDRRPSARQLWPPPIGAVELGIIGCRHLILPFKQAGGGGAVTATYAVAKYGPKWARSRTASCGFSPTWNEQYTWPVYDVATTLTVAVFEESNGACEPLGRLRIRISALDSGCSYRMSYPLFLLGPNGFHRTGEIELAIRFTRAGSPLDLLHTYGQPILPVMHHVNPIGGGAARLEQLRLAAARLVAAHLARSEPSLPQEAVMHVLEADARGSFSMRRMRARWSRVISSLSWARRVARWMQDTRTWRNPTATILTHVALVLLICHPGLIIPALVIHVALTCLWNRRKSPRGAASTGHVSLRASQLEAAEQLTDELDEEFDPTPSAKAAEVVRARYDRLRAAAWRAEALLDSVAAGTERLSALMTWRDRRATWIFIATCLAVAAVLLTVPTKVAAAAAGLYWLRHPIFREAAAAPPRPVNFFRRLPTLSDQIM